MLDTFIGRKWYKVLFGIFIITVKEYFYQNYFLVFCMLYPVIYSCYDIFSWNPSVLLIWILFFSLVDR